jgi:hypothetical protein
VQPVDILVANIRRLHMRAEERSDVFFDDVCIAGAGGWTYTR